MNPTTRTIYPDFYPLTTFENIKVVEVSARIAHSYGSMPLNQLSSNVYIHYMGLINLGVTQLKV